MDDAKIAELDKWSEARQFMPYYDKYGKPIGLGTWVKLGSDEAYRCIGYDHTPRSIYLISTIWMGLSSNFGGAPQIFETMVFDESNQFESNGMMISPTKDQWRYSTLEEAKLGHAALLKKWTGVEKRIKK